MNRPFSFFGVVLCCVTLAFPQSGTLSITPTEVTFPPTAVGDTSFATYTISLGMDGTNSSGYQLEVWAPVDASVPKAMMVTWDEFGEGYADYKFIMYGGAWGRTIHVTIRFIPTASTPVDPSGRGFTVTRLTNRANSASSTQNVTILSAPLPVQLASFRGSYDVAGRNVRLEWKTLSETNNYGFEVQRKMAFEPAYATVSDGFVPGHGTSLVPQSYSFNDIRADVGPASYRLKQIDLDNTVHCGESITVEKLTGVDGTRDEPQSFALEQNYPNPFNPSTVIRYALPVRSHVTLSIYNTLGQSVAVLVNTEQASGYHEIEFNASMLPTGTYLCRLQAGNFTQSRTLLLVR
jgi:hypothetical protein